MKTLKDVKIINESVSEIGINCRFEFESKTYQVAASIIEDCILCQNYVMIQLDRIDENEGFIEIDNYDSCIDYIDEVNTNHETILYKACIGAIITFINETRKKS